jgi:hypothetical protein
MGRAIQFGWPEVFRSSRSLGTVLTLTLSACLLLVTPSAGQPHGVPPPSVTAMGHFPLPSVTSIPNTSFGNHFHNRVGFNHGGRFRRGSAFAVPYYYIPLGDYGYGYDYDYVGGPDMYSGPPNGYSDPTLHIIVEQPPARSYRGPAEGTQAEITPPPPAVQDPPPARDAKPSEPTVLVFHDGHRQEVSNYAIMGQTVYVLDDRTQKIPLANLDVPATVKANDDRGMEFKIPADQHPAQKKNSDLQPNGTPGQNPPPAPPNVASILP